MSGIPRYGPLLRSVAWRRKDSDCRGQYEQSSRRETSGRSSRLALDPRAIAVRAKHAERARGAVGAQPAASKAS